MFVIIINLTRVHDTNVSIGTSFFESTIIFDHHFIILSLKKR